MTNCIVGKDEFGDKVFIAISSRGGAVIGRMGPEGQLTDHISLCPETALKLAEEIVERARMKP